MSTQLPAVPLVEPVAAFDGVTEVVAEPLRFKARLAIGENAYASLRMINKTREVWDVLGAAGAGAAVVKSGVLGIGAATTPIGWVALAALASGGACYGLYRWLGDTKGARVIEIPKFLNTPLDTLGLALFDLIAPLALRLAAVDGHIEAAERTALVEHLVDDWGLDARFVARAIEQIEPRVLQGSVDEMATELSAFLHANPDCNHQAIATDLGQFLRRLLEAGGPLTEAEEQALAVSLALLRREPDGALTKAWGSAKAGAEQLGTSAREAAGQLGTSAKEAAGHLSTSAKEAAVWTRERLPSPEELQAAAGKALDTARSGAEQLGASAKEAAGVAAAQVEQSARKAAAWAQDKLPDAGEVQDAARRTVRVAKAGIERITRRPGR